MARSFARTVRRAATSRVTFVVFVILLAAWAGFAADIAPGELFFPLFPAFVVAFFLDTVAHNQFGLRVSWLFYPFAFVCLYVEAACVGGAVELYRNRRAAALDRPEET